MKTPLSAMRLIHWTSGAPMSSELPISDPYPDPGLLGPDSVSWRLHEEQWLITAGARAFLMQAAHPKVAQGAAGRWVLPCTSPEREALDAKASLARCVTR